MKSLSLKFFHKSRNRSPFSSQTLKARVGRRYSHPNLNNMRKFYLMYPICQTSNKSASIFQKSENLSGHTSLGWFS